MNAVVADMLQQAQEFFAKGEITNSSALILPSLIKELKERQNALISPSQLKGYHKDLRYVGYSLSYLDSIPELLQTRVIKSNGVIYGQLTMGLRCVEDIYGWTSRGNRVQLENEFPVV